MHGVNDVELGDAVVGDLEIDEDFGDDSDDVALGGKSSFRNGMHEADVGTAIDETYVAFREDAA